MDSQLRIASMGKMFTAVAALKLIEQGALRLDDTIDKFLPNYPDKDFTSKTTVEMLLTHRAGTGDIFGPEFDAHKCELKTIEDYLNFYAGRGETRGYINPDTHPTAGKFSYSNFGYMLLGAVISNVAGKTENDKRSGQGYYDYVKENVFDRLGMTSTGMEPEHSGVSHLATPYIQGPSGWTAAMDALPYRGSPAGGGYSTAGDLLKFANALTGGSFLNKNSLAMLENGMPTENEPGGAYGHGSEVSTANGVRSFGHSGGFDGMQGAVDIFTKRGYVSIVLSNFDPSSTPSMPQYITDLLRVGPAK
jgi:CubicO group peptidase (beta-lactamase class C family)